MKKPNITPGEWKHSHNGHYAEVGHDLSPHNFISFFDNEYTPIPEEMSIANAKSTSALPELIEALINTEIMLEHLPDMHPMIEADIAKQRKQNQDALIKAGCEL